MIIAVGGPPGSGKTTAAERFAQAHAYHIVSAGLKFRAAAKAREMSLEAFSRAAEADHEIDRSLDRQVLEEVLRYDAGGRDVIVDGRIQAQLLTARRIPCMKVLLDAPLAVRVQRIAAREGKPSSVVEREILEREASERSRYKAIYGIDLDDVSVFDVVVDSSTADPDEIVDIIRSRVEG
jgi:CMP/dCMP kinase